MIGDDDIYFDGAERPEHGAFSFCYSWGDNVIIHTPTRYSQATRDFFRQPIVRNYLNYGIQADDIYDKIPVLQMLAYTVNHDRKHIYQICNSIQDHKCIVLTDYADMPSIIEKSTLNGAIIHEYSDKQMKSWALNWHDNGPNKPLIMNYDDYGEYFSNFTDIPVHIVDTPVDGAYGIVDLIPFDCELHIYPVMGRLYSCLLRIADSHEKVYLEQIDFAIKTCIPDTISYDEDEDAKKRAVESLRESIKKHEIFIQELLDRLAKEHDPDFISLIEKKVMTDHNKLETELQSVPYDSLRRTDGNLHDDVRRIMATYSEAMRTIYKARRAARGNKNHE